MENISKKIKEDKDTLGWIAVTLLIIGGLNWGLVGLLGFDLIKEILGNMTLLSRIVYLLVGASAVYVLVVPPKFCKK